MIVQLYNVQQCEIDQTDAFASVTIAHLQVNKYKLGYEFYYLLRILSFTF